MGIYSKFAMMLDYPEGALAEAISDCAGELAATSPEAQAQLLEFHDAVAAKSVAQLQEIYTAIFDLRPDCTPNIGYHLFGDDARRGVFLAELKGRMEAQGMTLGGELSDHLSLILKYMDLAEEERPVLIEDCIVPGVTKMIEVLKNSANPYEHALQALLAVAQAEQATYATRAELIV